jgi:hypothetical protein
MISSTPSVSRLLALRICVNADIVLVCALVCGSGCGGVAVVDGPSTSQAGMDAAGADRIGEAPEDAARSTGVEAGVVCLARASRPCKCSTGTPDGKQYCHADGSGYTECLGCEGGPSCSDGLVVHTDGTVFYCGGYNCTYEGMCRTTCSTDVDCDRALYVCSAGQCVCNQPDCESH